MLEHALWVEKYRPRTISDTILPANLKKTFQVYVEQGNIPNLLFSGSPGVGKTTVARALCDELGIDYIIINGSLNGNIDTLRNEIKDFASSVSFTGRRKMVILDEADYLNAQSTQPALRNFMEEFSSNCGFILTVNLKNRLIPALLSRCSVVEFKIAGSDKAALAGEFMKRVIGILDKEGVSYEKPAVAEVIMKYFPDWRRVINELQRYAATGKIDAGILTSLSNESFKALVGYIKAKNFTEMRKWVVENGDIDPAIVMRRLYDDSVQILEKGSIPQMVIILADYQYKAGFVTDQEINLVACLTELMVEMAWK